MSVSVSILRFGRSAVKLCAALAAAVLACAPRTLLAAPHSADEAALKNRTLAVIDHEQAAGSLALWGGTLLAAAGAGLTVYGALPCHGTCGDAQTLGLAFGIPLALGGVVSVVRGAGDLGSAHAMRDALDSGRARLAPIVGRAYGERFDGEAQLWSGVGLLALAPVPFAFGLRCQVRSGCSAPGLYYAASGVALASGALAVWLGLDNLSAARRTQRWLQRAEFSAAPACFAKGCLLVARGRF